MVTNVSLESAPYSISIDVLSGKPSPSLSPGGGEPGCAVQLLSINNVKGESSISVDDKSLSPLIATASPAPTLPSNSN